jgi:hypothetical protein
LKSRFYIMMLVAVLSVGSVFAGNDKDIKTLPEETKVTLSPVKNSPTACIIQKHDDTAYGYSLEYLPGERTVTYFNPSGCGYPTYPFEITGMSFTLFGPTGSQWPVTIDIVIYDLDTSHWSCNGPITELCRYRIVCDSATWCLPYYGTYMFPEPCCVEGTFFAGIEYADVNSGVLPGICFDKTPHPDTCDNWVYVANQWREFYDFWGNTAGYPLFWVYGETHSVNCCPDDDADAVCDWTDNCPGTSNPLQEDADGDGVGDACDICPGYDDLADFDSDGLPDSCDNCPENANAGQSDSDLDGVGDVCDNCPDDANSDQLDSDSDGWGDLCDNCPSIANPSQENADSDAYGDACDDDDDNDGILDDGDASGTIGDNPCSNSTVDCDDNCQYVYNPGQEDTDYNLIGDACQSCCVGYTGNVDCSEDEAPDISDITRLIDFLYISHTALCCPEEADVDVSGGGPDISDITYLIDHLYLSHRALKVCPY